MAYFPDSSVPICQHQAGGAGIHERAGESFALGQLCGNALALVHFPVEASVPGQHGAEQQQDRDQARYRPAHYGFNIEAVLVEGLLEQPVLHERYAIVPPPARIERRINAIAGLEELLQRSCEIRRVARNTPPNAGRFADRKRNGETFGIFTSPAQRAFTTQYREVHLRIGYQFHRLLGWRIDDSDRLTG
ncbi:hypothetical protein D3C84_487570 [compost metagenome]